MDTHVIPLFKLLNPDSQRSPTSTAQLGAFYAVLAYVAWGLLPIYWKLFGQTPAVEVLSHRMIWSAAFLTMILVAQRRSAEIVQLFKFPGRLGILLTTALLLSFNWGLYIYGVNSDRVIETSLGYFINPLVNVLFGFLFLKERLKTGQKIAVLLACLGVVNFIWYFGSVPWIALGLAFSFALYGLLRKIVSVAPMVGLTIETALITPLAIVAVGYWEVTGIGNFGKTWTMDLLFIGCGIATSFPLLWFNNAAKRLRLSTLGFFQYMAPTMQLLLGVFLYHEPFTRIHAVTFGFIWSALAVYSITSFINQRSQAD